jgi:hypothetical protein
MVLEHRHLLEKNLNKEEIEELDSIISKYQSRSQVFDSTGQSSAPAKEEPKKK